jgi:hypothetical protein
LSGIGLKGKGAGSPLPGSRIYEFAMYSLVLFHHDPDRTDDDLDRQLEYCLQRIQSAGATLKCVAAAEGMVFEL